MHLVHGSVYVWGYSKACGFKTDVLSPSCVHTCSEQNSVIDMAGGDSHSMILTSSGTLYSWGNNFEVRTCAVSFCSSSGAHTSCSLTLIRIYIHGLWSKRETTRSLLGKQKIIFGNSLLKNTLHYRGTFKDFKDEVNSSGKIVIYNCQFKALIILSTSYTCEIETR